MPTAAVRKGDDLVCYSMTGEAADLVLANAGRVPILQSHRRSIDYLLGAIGAAWFDDGVLCFTGRLAPVDEAERLWSLLSAGFPLSVSFGHPDRRRHDHRRDALGRYAHHGPALEIG